MQFLDRVRFASIGILGASAVTLTAASAQAPPGDNTSTIDPVALFATSCGWCHQSGGRVEGRGPKLAGSDKSDEFIVNRIKNGKSPGMPAFGRSFNDDQIKTILGYIRGLQAAP
jgi:mono/diheme cytochrome c family protein